MTYSNNISCNNEISIKNLEIVSLASMDGQFRKKPIVYPPFDSNNDGSDQVIRVFLIMELPNIFNWQLKDETHQHIPMNGGSSPVIA